MSVSIRIRNGMAPSGGQGGATEGDIRGDTADIISSLFGVVNKTGGHCLVHQAVTPDMTVIVDAGVAYIPNSSYSELDSDQIKFWEAVVAGTAASRTLTISANSSGQARVDLIALKMDSGIVPDENASNIATLVVVTGTPGAGTPATPANHVVFATVAVANGASSIANAVITDVRAQLILKPAVIPPITPTSGAQVQAVHTATGAVATGTTVTPFDDTIPQNNEGNQFFTLAITPTSATNKLVIEGIINLSTSSAGVSIVALFQDSTANALAAGTQFMVSPTAMYTIPIKHEVVAGTTSATTFKMRVGLDSAATITLNGSTGARKLGGVYSSYLRITEVAV